MYQIMDKEREYLTISN